MYRHRLSAFSPANSFELIPSASCREENYAHILLPTGLDIRERSALRLAVHLAAMHTSRLTVLHVVAPMRSHGNRKSMHWLDAIDCLHESLSHAADLGTLGDSHRLIESKRVSINEYVDKHVSKELRELVKVQTQCCVGDITRETVSFAEQSAVDLVILSSRHSRFWVPTVASNIRNVFRNSRTEVLLLRTALPLSSSWPASKVVRS